MMSKKEWVLYPVCRSKNRSKIREDTVKKLSSLLHEV